LEEEEEEHEEEDEEDDQEAWLHTSSLQQIPDTKRGIGATYAI
jgi:hypothetical protein